MEVRVEMRGECETLFISDKPIVKWKNEDGCEFGIYNLDNIYKYVQLPLECDYCISLKFRIYGVSKKGRKKRLNYNTFGSRWFNYVYLNDKWKYLVMVVQCKRKKNLLCYFRTRVFVLELKKGDVNNEKV